MPWLGPNGYGFHVCWLLLLPPLLLLLLLLLPLLRFHSDAFLPSILRYLYSRILKGLAVIERTVAGHLRPPLFNGKVARHVRSLVLNGDVRLGY